MSTIMFVSGALLSQVELNNLFALPAAWWINTIETLIRV
ncbi:unnamed protein product [Brassica rapa subsp. trilocularis]